MLMLLLCITRSHVSFFRGLRLPASSDRVNSYKRACRERSQVHMMQPCAEPLCYRHRGSILQKLVCCAELQPKGTKRSVSADDRWHEP